MLWMIPALFGGRTPREIADGEPEDFNVLPGLMAMVALGMFYCCQYLYWHSFPHQADRAVLIAAICTLLYGLVYWSLLRSLDDAGWLLKGMIVAVLSGLTAFNAYLAGHELLLLAYGPQVQAQALRSAGTDTVTFASDKENAMGLPALRNELASLQAQLSSAQTQVSTLPPAVGMLLQQSAQCDADASQRQQQVPNDTAHPMYHALRRAATTKTRDCQQTASVAQSQLASHQKQWQTTAAQLQTDANATQQKLRTGLANHAKSVTDATPGIAAAHATGAGRYDALWRAVNVGTVPKLAAYGLMFFSIVLDTIGLLLKLFQAPDAIARQRQHESGLARAESRATGYMMATLRRGAKAAAASARDQLQGEFDQHAQYTLSGETIINLEAQAFERIHRRAARAQRRTQQPLPGLVRRMRTVFDGVRQQMGARFQQGAAKAQA